MKSEGNRRDQQQRVLQLRNETGQAAKQALTKLLLVTVSVSVSVTVTCVHNDVWSRSSRTNQ